MNVVKNCPAYIRLNDISEDELRTLKSILAYKNLNTQYLYQQAKKNKYQYNANPDRWHEHALDLKSKINQTALFEDNDGYYTYAGLLTKLQKMQLVDSYDNKITPPSPRALPWALNYMPMKLYPYQQEAIDLLLDNPHSSIELPTGSGKSEIIKQLCKNTGLRVLIITPYVAIAKQMYDDLVESFGKKYVGFYGDGKKQFKQQIVIGIAASLTRVQKATDDWENLSNRDVVISDESHLTGSPTLSDILLSLCKDIPFRWSVSATQMRNNGTDLLLQGLIGDIVYRKEFKELAALGYLSPLKFRIFSVYSDSKYSKDNPLKVKQEHFLYNRQVVQLAAGVANQRVAMGESVLIMIDELEQVTSLKPFLTVPFEVASSESNVAEQVKAFNDKKIKLIIGTSACATGANFKPTETMILLIGGKSEVKFKQAIGRCTRLYPGKRFCQVVDFSVIGIHQLQRHLDERLEFYKELSDDVEFIDGD